MLTLVPAIRHAGGLRVYGAGSKAMIALDNKNSVVGALRRWHTATLGEKIQPTITVVQVRAEIERQLTPNVPADAKAVVDVVKHGYYDAHGSFLQPIYRFEANLVRNSDNRIFARIGGYIPMGKVLEPIPDLTTRPAGGGSNPGRSVSVLSAGRRWQGAGGASGSEHARLNRGRKAGGYRR
jgi:hypothetical protein